MICRQLQKYSYIIIYVDVMLALGSVMTMIRQTAIPMAMEMGRAGTARLRPESSIVVTARPYVYHCEDVNNDQQKQCMHIIMMEYTSTRGRHNMMMMMMMNMHQSNHRVSHSDGRRMLCTYRAHGEERAEECSEAMATACGRHHEAVEDKVAQAESNHRAPPPSLLLCSDL